MHMIIFLHVASALSSLMIASYLALRPSRALLRVTYGLSALMLVSGGYLAWSAHAHVLQTCMSGLLYLGTIVLLLGRARAVLIRRAQ